MFCSAELYNTFPAKWETCLSETQKTASFVSPLACVQQLSAEADTTAAVREGAALPMEAEGHPDVSASPRRDSRCHVVGLSRNLCAVDKPLFRSRNSRLSERLLNQTLFHYVPTEFNAEKKKKHCAKIPIKSTCTDKKALLQHTEMLMWALKPQEQVLLFCKKRELKLQSSNC